MNFYIQIFLYEMKVLIFLICHRSYLFWRFIIGKLNGVSIPTISSKNSSPPSPVNTTFTSLEIFFCTRKVVGKIA